jgi:hypothetical protein
LEQIKDRVWGHALEIQWAAGTLYILSTEGRSGNRCAVFFGGNILMMGWPLITGLIIVGLQGENWRVAEPDLKYLQQYKYDVFDPFFQI